MKYEYFISPKMQNVAKVLTEAFAGMDHCVSELQRNLLVEVPKKMCEAVRAELKLHFPDVVLIKNAYPIIEDLHDFILVKALISEAPVNNSIGVNVPELEKILIDLFSDKEYSSLSKEYIQQRFQLAFEIYDINTSKLLRYAGRKGKKEEAMEKISLINTERVATIKTIQKLFKEEPVKKAWVFGSFSRMEEGPESDLDILVDLDKSNSYGLLQFASMINKIENNIKRKVDIVTKDSVKSFALNNINKDKILIYERS